MIYICADDYGLSQSSAKHIEECVKERKLNKVSVFPNGVIPDFVERIDHDKLDLSLHLNLVEGKCMADKEEIPLLVNENGIFKHSFEGLFLLSFSSKRKEMKQQIKTEIRAQLAYWISGIPQKEPLIIDSHQHVHMIPLIFEELLAVIREENLKVQYMRYPAEPVLPYLKTPSLYLTYHPVNLIKQWLLKALGVVNRHSLQNAGIRTGCFMGILFSGHMDERRVKKVLPHYLKLAEKKNSDLEVLFHPGYMEEGDSVLDIHKTGFNKFYASSGRKTEFDAVKNLEI